MVNGAIERFNGTLKQMLKKLSVEKTTQWDRYIDPALFTYRSCIHRRTGFSPFKPLYGRTMKGPMDILKKICSNSDDELNENRTNYQYVIDLKNRISETCEIAVKALEWAHEVNKQYFDRKTRNRQFKVGDKVLLLLSDSQHKLRVFWKVPFTVFEKLNEWEYKIQFPNKFKTFHANMLKKYEERIPKDVCAGIAIID